MQRRFVSLGLVYLVLVYFFMPETSRLSLEQIATVYVLLLPIDL
jgi:hypothetical protein